MKNIITSIIVWLIRPAVKKIISESILRTGNIEDRSKNFWEFRFDNRQSNILGEDVDIDAPYTTMNGEEFQSFREYWDCMVTGKINAFGEKIPRVGPPTS